MSSHGARRASTIVLLALASACGGDAGTAPEPAGPAAALAVSAGGDQEAIVDTKLPAPIAARVTDDAGRPVPNAVVYFFVTSGGGTVTDRWVRSNDSGIALTTWKLGASSTVAHRVTAQLQDSVTAAVLDTAIFTATAKPGPAARFERSTFPMYVLAATPSATPMRVLLRDALENPIPGATVSWTVVSGDATLPASSALTDETGFAEIHPIFGENSGPVVVRATHAGFPALEFVTTSRYESTKFRQLAGGAYGIARLESGELVTTLIDQATLARTSIANPSFELPSIVVGRTPTTVDAFGGKVYVANMDGSGLSVVDLAGFSSVAVTIPGAGHNLRVNPRGDRVFVTSQWGNVYMVDVGTLAIVDTVVVGGGPWGLAFHSTGTDSLVYVTSRDAGTVVEADTKTGNVLRTFRTAGRPHGIDIAPDGSTLYVADNTLGRLLYVRVSDGGVVREVPLDGAFELALTPDGATLYVTTERGNVVVVDVATGSVRRTFVTNGYPRQIVTSADGDAAWAANGGGWIDLVRR